MMNFLIKGPILLASCTHNSTLLWFSISFYSPHKMWTLTLTKISPHRKSVNPMPLHALFEKQLHMQMFKFIHWFILRKTICCEWIQFPPARVTALLLCCQLWLEAVAIEDTGGVNRNSHAALSSIINEHHLHHSAPSILSGSGWLMSGEMEPKLRKTNKENYSETRALWVSHNYPQEWREWRREWKLNSSEN